MSHHSTEIISTRVFPVSRRRLFTAFSDPRQLEVWWGPKGFTNTFDEFHFRPGGDWKFTMHGPDGSNYANHSIFAEIVNDERIVFDHIAPNFRMTITFTDTEDGTRMTWCMRFESAEICDRFKPICIPSNEENFDRLESHLAHGTSPVEFHITRTFAAPRSAVFQAWTEPRLLADWWGPHAFTNPVCEFDAREGGTYRIVMRSPDGTDYPLTGTCLEVVAPERLVTTLDPSGHPAAWHDLVKSDRAAEDSNPAGELRQTVIFTEKNGGTQVAICTRFKFSAIHDAFLQMGMNEGWHESLDSLNALLTNI